jgi:hypothetical protein
VLAEGRTRRARIVSDPINFYPSARRRAVAGLSEGGAADGGWNERTQAARHLFCLFAELRG